jgi:hypothetical protein
MGYTYARSPALPRAVRAGADRGGSVSQGAARKRAPDPLYPVYRLLGDGVSFPMYWSIAAVISFKPRLIRLPERALTLAHLVSPPSRAA